MADQLRRAALSISLNIAEGTGRFDKDERRFYTTARGSALECAAVLDALEAIHLASEQELQKPREMLFRIVSMLTKMIQV
jgi:four helix bundle protein